MGHEMIRYLVNLFHDTLRSIYMNQNKKRETGLLEVKDEQEIRLRVVDTLMSPVKPDTGSKLKKDKEKGVNEYELHQNFHASLILFLMQYQDFLKQPA